MKGREGTKGGKESRLVVLDGQLKEGKKKRKRKKRRTTKMN